MATYKVSYVIIDIEHPGAILNQDTRPERGQQIELQDQLFEIIEVFDVVPPRGDFHFVHATCRPLGDPST